MVMLAQAPVSLVQSEVAQRERQVSTSLVQVGPGLGFGRVCDEWFGAAETMVRAKISSETASADVLCRVQQHNPESFWAVYRCENEVPVELTCLYGQLLLNSDGHKALLDRSLDRRNPPNELLAAPGAPIAAVYIWCVVAKNRMALLQASMLKHAGHLFGVPRYATLATEDSMKFGAGAGFEPVSPADAQKGGLFRLPAALPILKRVDSAALTVKVVETASELDQAKAVRVATFVSEQKCPFGEEFDGNDYSAQHLVGYVDGEPAATMRIRYFAGFAKWERYCVRDSFRKTGIKDSLIAYAIDLVSRKGYTRIYFQAEPSLKVFWGRRGFSVSSRPGRIQFSDREYQEFEMHVAPHQKAITLADNPMMLNRVEGQWDCAGVLDRSQRRLQRAAA